MTYIKPKYKSEFCGTVVELGKGGATESNIAAELGIGLVQLRQWVKAKPAFGEALEVALTASKSFHERRLQESYEKKDGNASLIIALLRANWPESYQSSQYNGSAKSKGGKQEEVDPGYYQREIDELIRQLKAT
ncbi:hypothetical protein [Polynucleobacter sp. UB-Siik-W21]|uniref:hypothetical protein n=1 Tax=Polynucleobacter sp. UB-Siik-W21 TaxID=1855646 RepID=UPI001BFE331E|nr:hypothetical protein [Polynucleobacter sp. UB-Siik-W21]QWD69618.1 hypothetical protein C2756_06735 [Polynucleobacter sp. UB-Siik-W21]